MLDAIAAVLLALGVLAEIIVLLVKRRSSSVAAAGSDPASAKQQSHGAHHGGVSCIHAFSAFSVIFFVYYHITESMRDEYTGVEMEDVDACQDDTIDSVSGFSHKELCEMAEEFFSLLEKKDYKGVTSFMAPFVGENIAVMLNPRGMLPEFLMPDCLTGREEVIALIETAFSAIGVSLETAQVNATDSRTLDLYLRGFTLGITMHNRVRLTLKDRVCEVFMMACCGFDDWPLPVQNCVA